MGKMTKYVLLLSVVLLLFHFGGLIEDTPISVLIDLLLNPKSLATSNLYTLIAAALTAVATAGIIIGSLASTRTEIVVKAGVVEFLIVIGWDLIAIFNKLAEMNVSVATLIISPLLIVYLLTAIEWWMGRD